MITQHHVARTIDILREGGSAPALVEADNGQHYVLKFRGAGQGAKALVAELIAGELLRALGLPVPALVLLELAEELARSERDPEIQDVMRNSLGLNLGMAYLPGALAFDPLLTPPPAPELASAVVWADALLTNVDRTARNPNMLLVDGQLWLIDHGATLYMHHNWPVFVAQSQARFPYSKDHVLLPFASALAAADAMLSARLSPSLLQAILAQVPDSWLPFAADGLASADEQRAAYVTYLTARLAAPRPFAEEARHAFAQRV